MRRQQLLGSSKRRDPFVDDVGTGDPLVKKESRAVVRTQGPSVYLADREAAVDGRHPGASSDISRALRQECQIPHRSFALIVADDGSGLRTFTSPALAPHESAIFTSQLRNSFARIYGSRIGRTGRRRANADAEPVLDARSSTADSPIPPRARHPRSPTSRVLSKTLPSHKRASSVRSNEGHRLIKRPKSSRMLKEAESDSDVSDVQDIAPSTPYVGLRIGDEDEVTNFYRSRLQQLQQLGCKMIAKAWIKTIEPRKQTKHPYRGGPERAPSWWPATTQHKEPDHLLKQERINLLVTMLRLDRVPIATLAEATNELQTKIEKWALLEEIYKVAKQEERLRHGEIDADTVVYIAPSPRCLLPDPDDRKTTAASDHGGTAGVTKAAIKQEDLEDESARLTSPIPSQAWYCDSVDHPSGGLPPTEASVKEESPPPLDLLTAHPEPRQQTGLIASLFPPSFLRAATPMTNAPSSSSYSIHPMAAAAAASVTDAAYQQASACLLGPSDGSVYLPRSPSFSGASLCDVFAGWPALGATDPRYSPYIAHPPTVPSQPAAPVPYQLLPSSAASHEGVLLNLTQGPPGSDSAHLAAVTSVMVPHSFGAPSLTGSLRATSLGGIHPRLTESDLTDYDFEGYGGLMGSGRPERGPAQDGIVKSEE